MSKAAIRPTTLKIDADTKERMQRLADVRHRSAHWLMLEAAAAYQRRYGQHRGTTQTATTADKTATVTIKFKR